MKKILLLTLVLTTTLLWSCGDNTPNEPTPPTPGDELTLRPDKTEISANGNDVVTFVVAKGAATTTKAEIYLVSVDGKTKQTKLDKYNFSCKKNGSYVFEARLGKDVSKPITITATGAVSEKYYRKVAVFKTTGTTCAWCPKGTRELDDLDSRGFPDRLVRLDFHGYNSDDPMYFPLTLTLVENYKLGSYPSALVDLRTGFSENLFTPGKAAITASLEEYPASCGIRIESKITNGQIHITAGVTSNTGGNFRIAAFISEDKIVATQNDGGIYNDKYIHNHTARKMLSGVIIGDDLGTLAVDQEKVKSFTSPLDPKWVVENLNVVVYVTDASGCITNIAECKIDNGKLDYELNENK